MVMEATLVYISKHIEDENYLPKFVEQIQIMKKTLLNVKNNAIILKSSAAQVSYFWFFYRNVHSKLWITTCQHFKIVLWYH